MYTYNVFNVTKLQIKGGTLFHCRPDFPAFLLIAKAQVEKTTKRDEKL
jgi:hypothetical protein